MKLSKSLVGKQVRIQWKDPRTTHVKSRLILDHRDIARGRATLATWTEWGYVEDITEGVLHLRQGLGVDPPLEKDQEHEVALSIVPEELIEKITTLTDAEEVT